MNKYEKEQIKKLKKWKKKVAKKPFIIDKVSKSTQNKINSMLPDKYHEVMTLAIKNMTKMVLLGSNYTNTKPIKDMSLEERDELAYKKIKLYKTTATIEGAGTGAGGILWDALVISLARWSGNRSIGRKNKTSAGGNPGSLWSGYASCCIVWNELR